MFLTRFIRVKQILIVIITILAWNVFIWMKYVSLDRSHKTSTIKMPVNDGDNPSPDISTRTSLVEQECQRNNTSWNRRTLVKNVMMNRRSRLAYCFIPKCGCTFWKRVIRFLNGDYPNKNITSPFQIRRLDSHTQEHTNPDTFVPFRVFKKLFRDYTSFMFVREPYARLWSAYVDKFYLPDFWTGPPANLHKLRPSRPHNCVHDMTFEEFVNVSLSSKEPHWDPMHTMCDPCAFKPTVIGRVESFGSDSRHILHRVNLSWILDGYDHNTHVEEELATLTEYNIGLMTYKPGINKCISKLGLFYRLWKAFQINGYLPAAIQPPMFNNNITTAEFSRKVFDVYREMPNTPEAWRKQRTNFMNDAYKTISTSTLNALRKKYTRDFTLFNYDPRPVELFSNRL